MEEPDATEMNDIVGATVESVAGAAEAVGAVPGAPGGAAALGLTAEPVEVALTLTIDTDGVIRAQTDEEAFATHLRLRNFEETQLTA